MSRMERQMQLNNLESVIEKKKREIQAKLEAQKKKETEDALIKIQKHSETPARRPFWKGNKKDSPTQVVKIAEPPKITNVFSNDGSFLDQFRKLSKSGLMPDKVDVETLANARAAEEKEKERRKIVEEEKNQRQIERNMRERERELRKIDRDRDRRRSEQRPRECSPKRIPLDANIKIELPPPGVVQLVPQIQLIAPVVLTPMPQIILNPPPPFTTNEIQLQATGITASSAGRTCSLPLLPPPISNMLPLINTQSIPHIALPITAPIATIPPPLPMTPYSIPPPSPIQVESIPPPPSPPRGNYSPPSKKRKRREFAISSCALPPPGYCDEIPLPPLPNEVPAALRRDNTPSSSSSLLDSGTRQLAKMIATSGDQVEDILRVAHKDDPALRFLFDVNCGKYKLFRNYIEACRSGNIDESDHESKQVSEGESVEDENKYDPADADDSDSSLSDRNDLKYDPTTAHDSDSCSSDIKNVKKEIKYDPDSDSDSRDHFKIEKKYPVQRNEMIFNSIKTEMTDFGYDENGRPSFSGIKSEDYKSNIPFIKSEPIRETKRERKSRWGDKSADAPPLPISAQLPNQTVFASTSVPSSTIGTNQIMMHTMAPKDPGLIAYARQTFGSINLSEEDWKRAEDHYKINLLYQNMIKKREELDKLAQQGKFKYEYDSDEDTEGGTWEHKLRNQEMTATQLWADELTRQAEGKHHIGDFLPPEELDRFLEKYNAVKSGREPDLSDYKEFKLREDNVGYKLLQKMGWNEGQGLGQEGQGMVNPVNKANTRMENQGLGLERPDGVDVDDDEYSAYRKRMMLAYRFRPNPLNNPRRPYY